MADKPLTPEEKQAIYDEVDKVMSGDAEMTPELEAKMDQCIREDMPELAEELGLNAPVPAAAA